MVALSTLDRGTEAGALYREGFGYSIVVMKDYKEN